MGVVYDLCVAAFDEADWAHGEPDLHETLGTTLWLGDRLVGGSLRVHDGSIVRILAWGAPDVPEDRLPAFAALCSAVNPRLLVGSLEHDPVLGAVVRCGADLAGVMDEFGEVADPAAARRVILGLATTATAVLDGLWDVIAAVASGTPAHVALDRAATAEAPGLLRR